MNLKGKTAVITGASEGLGKQIAFKLAREGVSLALLARSVDKLREVKREAEKIGSPKVEYYVCDLRNNSQIENSTKQIIKDFKNIQILINNAGIWQKLRPHGELEISEIEDIVSTNLTGLMVLTNLLLPTLKKQEEAAIINVSSHSGVGAKPGQSAYAASKWGVRGFTEVLREDYKGTHIHVAGVYQGGVKTKLFEAAGDPKEKEKYETFTEPEDLAEVVVFMLSRPAKVWLHEVRVDRY